ncbi:Guanine nucleotide-binding protein subunit gamma 1 [Euphorbia peplus]|nr:Guanine nucleotide-binding protein subunit gamma 1 [Euphorbia peplus]
MDSETADAASDTRGKHRILAQLKRLDQEINFSQEELEELEKTDNVSTVCEELLRNIETMPDPLLSETTGPMNPSWERWFERPPEGCQCWIL